MNRKVVQTLIGVAFAATVAGGAAFAEAVTSETGTQSAVQETAAAEENTNTATENAQSDGNQTAETESETQTETETEPETLAEGTALLSDYGYVFGTLSDDGWESQSLDMKYTPGTGIKMDKTDSDKINTNYHGRFGEGKYVAYNEMIAQDESNGYVQLMVEVNPNNEGVEDVLDRFAEDEGLELVGKTRETEIAGKTFNTRTGVKDKQKYMIGVCEDEENLVIALKIRYESSETRKALVDGFEKLTPPEEETENVTESVTEAEESATEGAEGSVSMPEEFADEAVISSEQETQLQ